MKTTCHESVVPSAPSCILSEPPAEPLAVLGARAACALEQSLQRFVLAGDQNLGHLEVQAAQDGQNLLREAAPRWIAKPGDKANAPSVCAPNWISRPPPQSNNSN